MDTVLVAFNLVDALSSDGQQVVDVGLNRLRCLSFSSELSERLELVLDDIQKQSVKPFDQRQRFQIPGHEPLIVDCP